MPMTRNRTIQLLYVLIAAAGVYVFAHWPALTNPYVVNDDVRQQIFWMQQWCDPELYQNDLLTEYARNYVPWGVQAIYAAAAQFINPVQFTKILAGLLFVTTAGFFFGLGLQFRDDLAPIFISCTFCFMGGFMDKISGGLSQSFGFPLLVAFLFFLARNNLIGAGALIFLESVLNPYIFLLCLVTYAIFLTHNVGKIILRWSRERGISPDHTHGVISDQEKTSIARIAGYYARLVHELQATFMKPIPLLVSILLVTAGCVLILLKYTYYSPAEFGPLVTWDDMVGKMEYTAAGRYEIMPIANLFYELIRPWIFNLPFIPWNPSPAWILAFRGPLPAWTLACVGLTVIVYACIRGKWDLDLSGFRVFGYLFAASLIAYLAACVVIFKLFLPRRYVELSLNVFYCVAIGLCIRVALGKLVSRRIAFPAISTLFLILGAINIYHVEIGDYSGQVALYKFVQSSPKTTLIAGPPDLMDDVLTFGQRKAFVTYKLSHAWYRGYWAVIKKRTFDLFSAYYAEDPAEVNKFCRDNGIDYLIVRDEDFSPARLEKGQIHFEPFDTYIRDIVKSRTHFAVLDRKAFRPIYDMEGIRVIKMH
ncbi:MAG: hypothetical protein ACLQPD_10910 [Desulfomonilaceae bacterium]